MTRRVVEVVGREMGTGKGRVGRGLRECLRQTVQLKDEALAFFNGSVVFVVWRLETGNRKQGLGNGGLETGLRSEDMIFGTYHIIHQPITPNNDNVTLLDRHVESHCVFHGFVPAVRADLYPYSCSFSWAYRIGTGR